MWRKKKSSITNETSRLSSIRMSIIERIKDESSVDNKSNEKAQIFIHQSGKDNNSKGNYDENVKVPRTEWNIILRRKKQKNHLLNEFVRRDYSPWKNWTVIRFMLKSGRIWIPLNAVLRTKIVFSFLSSLLFQFVVFRCFFNIHCDAVTPLSTQNTESHHCAARQ